MGWLEDARTLYREWQESDEKRKHSLYIKNASEIPTDLSEIVSVSFSSNYDGPSPIIILTDVIPKSPNLESISIYPRGITWDEVCSLDLHKVEDLSFNLDGMPGTERLNAPELKKLYIYSNVELKPLELLVTPVPEIDFSGVPNLEELDLKHIQQVYPKNFEANKKLRKLNITGSNLSDLKWLHNATYSLTNLYVDAPIYNCAGIDCQKALETVMIQHSLLKDVSPFLELPNLKLLDLRNGLDIATDELRKTLSATILITWRDGDIEEIHRKVHELVRAAVRQIRFENSRAEHIDDIPELRRNRFLSWINQPFDERVKRQIRSEYDKELKRMSEDDYRHYGSLSVEETKELYTRFAMEYCPFLADLK